MKIHEETKIHEGSVAASVGGIRVLSGQGIDFAPSVRYAALVFLCVEGVRSGYSAFIDALRRALF